jgi:RecG-like helicase
VIGTHRLLQSDVQFKDLGLVVIDEEQRFGVMHKETVQAPAPDCGCADPERDAHSTHAVPGAERGAGHEHD